MPLPSGLKPLFASLPDIQKCSKTKYFAVIENFDFKKRLNIILKYCNDEKISTFYITPGGFQPRCTNRHNPINLLLFSYFKLHFRQGKVSRGKFTTFNADFQEQHNADFSGKLHPLYAVSLSFFCKKIKDAASIGAKTSFCFSSGHSEMLKNKIFCGY